MPILTSERSPGHGTTGFWKLPSKNCSEAIEGDRKMARNDFLYALVRATNSLIAVAQSQTTPRYVD
jgi:hypothetical protein